MKLIMESWNKFLKEFQKRIKNLGDVLDSIQEKTGGA